jgi:hypothetical protein
MRVQRERRWMIVAVVISHSTVEMNALGRIHHQNQTRNSKETRVATGTGTHAQSPAPVKGRTRHGAQRLITGRVGRKAAQMRSDAQRIDQLCECLQSINSRVGLFKLDENENGRDRDGNKLRDWQ